MSERLGRLVVPAYVALCLLLGGSTQGIWANLLLRLLALAMLVWAAWSPRIEALSPGERQLRVLVWIAGAWVALTLVPLPPGLWQEFPGRDWIAEGYRLLGQPLPWLPITLDPFASLATLLALLPPLAVIAAMLRRRAYTPAGLVWAVLAATIAGVLLGVLQVANSGSPDSPTPWHPYRITNYGVATGFFANSNHMATLLVVAIPLLAAQAAVTLRSAGPGQRRLAILTLLAALLAIVALGVVLNGSLAGLGLGIPVLAASVLLVLRRRRGDRRAPLLGIALLLVLAVAALVTAPIHSRFSGPEASASVDTRQSIYRTSLRMVGDYAPFGSGLGSYEKVYPRYEDTNTVDPIYVNHAHNDYIELAVELGVPGIVLVAMFLAWWATAAAKPWRTATSDAYARGATIATAAILAHSVLDFPLRTSAITALFAACLGLMVRPWTDRAARAKGDLWPSRHLSVD